MKATDRARQRRLAGAGLANQSDALALVYLEVDIVHNLMTGVRGRDIAQRKCDALGGRGTKLHTLGKGSIGNGPCANAAHGVAEGYLRDRGKGRVTIGDRKLATQRECATHWALARRWCTTT